MSRRTGTVARFRAPAMVLVVLLFTAVLSACSGGGKTYVIGTSADFPPMEFRDEAHPGQFTGFEIDMMKAIMGHLGLKFQFRDMKFAGLLPAVQNGQVDMVVSDVYDTAERAKVADFVDYIQSGLSVMVSAASGGSVSSYTDLCGKSLGIIAGSPSEQEIAQKANSDCTAAGKESIDVQTFQAVADELPQIDNGRLFAILEDVVSLSYIQLKNPTKYKVAFQDPSVTKSGIVLKKGSSLKSKLTEGFNWFKSSGEYANLIQKWGLPSSSQI
jgi:polar amino acid transport system substrate-binding protein